MKQHFIERNHLSLDARYRWGFWFITSAPRKASRHMPHSGKGWVLREKAEACKYAPRERVVAWVNV